MSKLDFSGFDDEDGEEGKRDRFEDELKKFKDLYGDSASEITSIEALEELVNYFLDHERYDEALRMVERLLTFVPYSADAWQKKGLILSNLYRYEDALAALETALGLNPVDPEILVNRGITLDDLGRLEEALASFERALEIEPTHE
ncbi:MAG TPA: tetratricopeptide repeat protein, partial [Bacteroidota bacterium]|nr:tetratricopeptide repeat protein [Bacteroidota bacterium]